MKFICLFYLLQSKDILFFVVTHHCHTVFVVTKFETPSEQRTLNYTAHYAVVGVVARYDDENLLLTTLRTLVVTKFATTPAQA